MMIGAKERIEWIERYCIVPNTGEPIRLLPFQIEFIETVFADGVLSAGLSIPRGNGKTGLLACIALSELFLNPHSPDVVCAGVKLRQITDPSGVYGAALRMVLINPVLRDQVRIYRMNDDPHIELLDRPGRLSCVAAKDPDGLLGGAWSMAIVDEFGAAFWTDERWGNILQSCGKRGTSSRVIGISTPNSFRSAMFSMRERYRTGELGEFTRWIEYSAPEHLDWKDPETWRLANPALGHYLDETALRQDVTEVPEWLFRIMRLGQWFEGEPDQGWLGIEGAARWDESALSDLSFALSRPTFIGVDKSAYNDCSAVVALQRDADRWLAMAFIFPPVKAGRIDHAAVKAKIRELCSTYRVEAIGYDDRFFVEGAQELEDEGLPMVPIKQNRDVMGPAYSELQNAILTGRFYHLPDADYRAHILNAVARLTDDEHIMLSKRRSSQKIDAAVATAIAMSVSGFDAAPLIINLAQVA